MYRLISTILVLSLLGGCGPFPMMLGQLSRMETMETVKQSRGEGNIVIYSYPYNTVYTTTLMVAEEQGLKVVEQDQEKGEIMLSRGATLFTWGERVAVFLTSSSDDSETEVEIISKQVMQSFASPDWTNKLFKGIEEKLKATR